MATYTIKLTEEEKDILLLILQEYMEQPVKVDSTVFDKIIHIGTILKKVEKDIKF